MIKTINLFEGLTAEEADAFAKASWEIMSAWDASRLGAAKSALKKLQKAIVASSSNAS